jgi:Fis family transcriptional regulator
VREQLDKLIAEMVDRGIPYPDAQREFERRFISRVLLRADGSLSKAAEMLGIHRNTLTRKMAEYRLKAARQRRDGSGS